MEFVLIAIVLTYALRYGVVDVAYAVRGKPNPRMEAAKARYQALDTKYAAKAKRRTASSSGGRLRRPGPARQYMATLWDDAWTDARRHHAERRQARLDRPQSDRPRSGVRSYFAEVREDIRRGVDDAWTKAAAKRRSRRPGPVRPEDRTETGPGAGVVVDGTVVDQDDVFDQAAGPWPKPESEPAAGPGRYGGPDCPCSACQHGDRDNCPWSGDEAIRPDRYVPPADPADEVWCPCLMCSSGAPPQMCSWPGRPDHVRPGRPAGFEIGRRDESGNWIDSTEPVWPGEPGRVFNPYTDQDAPGPSTTTPEGEGENVMSDTTTTEVTGLQSAITYAAGWEAKLLEGLAGIEQTIAALAEGGVQGEAAGHFLRAQEMVHAAAGEFGQAKQSMQSHLGVKEAYEATPDAGSREFVTAE